MISEMRREYLRGGFLREHLTSSPLDLFNLWFAQAVESDEQEPNAMALSTVKPNGQPSCRIVLLKEITSEGFTFFTNFLSHKGQEIEGNIKVAATFFWPNLERQVRIEGEAIKVSEDISNRYFASRPLDSQIGAIVSPQSQPIKSLDSLRKEADRLREENSDLKRPDHWGGYCINPSQIEFWQGGPHRLHTRFLYSKRIDGWSIEQLAP